MDGIPGARLRAVRAAVFTALTVTLSVASHVLLSKVPLPLTTVVAVAAAVFAAAYALAGRERRFRHIAGLLVPLELAADTVFTTGQHVCYGPSGGPVAGSLRAVGVDVLCGGGPVGAALPGVAAHDGGAWLNEPGPGLPLLLLGVHVAVGLAAAAYLRRGESALAGLARTAAALAFRPLRLVALAAGAPRPAADTRPRPSAAPRALGRGRLLVHSVGRRGPPCPGPAA
ncbi:hypothetical protein [Streptomyces sp. ODS05-4]|uniref:hypothetical protein n=1 Tax=Streptomyces sp. ODS05-4 TaxID=2944939 RepID=UPI00210C8034|nr:hypothetical protein [Streptomyces sp. ODS05-4]